jgi:hypothetical protein
MTATRNNTTFDFDSWATLAQQDPQAFEIKRVRVIEHAINRAPAESQQRLRCLQWKLDMIRHTSPTPMSACLRINRLLWESLTGKNGLLENLNRLGTGIQPQMPTKNTAKILAFHARKPSGLPQTDE